MMGIGACTTGGGAIGTGTSTRGSCSATDCGDGGEIGDGGDTGDGGEGGDGGDGGDSLGRCSSLLSIFRRHLSFR